LPSYSRIAALTFDGDFGDGHGVISHCKTRRSNGCIHA
jgi:hypothetical protein